MADRLTRDTEQEIILDYPRWPPKVDSSCGHPLKLAKKTSWSPNTPQSPD
jgi:hypothetical protein